VPQADESTSPTVTEILEQVIDLSVGAVTALMPALLLAMPGIVLLGLAVIPLAAGALVLGLVGAIVAAPFLLARKLLASSGERRRGRHAT